MQLTDYHAQYYAYALRQRYSSDSAEKFASAVAGAQVDLNPHQVDAALFAFHSPLSKGALLADEVGLGKTIEAGLVISQRWAERKRRILVITPANLRKQWHQELEEKFFLPCSILEAKSFKTAIQSGQVRPFESGDTIVICSYQFARAKASDIRDVHWELVVIDEAHRLRNVYKPSNVIANTLKQALHARHKLLLTATPLQNSLLELFGLASFIDEHSFGDLKSFREQFANLSQEQVFQTLKERLKPICHRTLRRQVSQYVSYTRRHSIVRRFSPDEHEDQLYGLVSEYLRRDNLQALPASQRSLMTLVLRKLLASSSFAIAGALTSLSRGLRARLGHKNHAPGVEEDLEQDYEALNETQEEWANDADGQLSASDRSTLEAEIRDLEAFASLATSIEHNAKGRELLKGLEAAFKRADELGAARKAIIFTESRRTQDYLLRVLSDSPFAGGIVLFNGSNADAHSRDIYGRWFERHRGTDRVTGSRSADMRSALVDYFREEGQIMIATEAGAEGINLQFCSLVVNYDLPWNPQRIEQRIGRCHRYGQKHDVVVVNFLNATNEADQRVFELLNEKFRLFDGIFGSSDEVLGAIESGVDFERRISDIYQRCRHPNEIRAAFDQLQKELSHEINEAMTRTRQRLLENFDDEVREKLKVRQQESEAYLNRIEQQLMYLTRHELQDAAEFTTESSFLLKKLVAPLTQEQAPLGLYELPRRSGGAHLYRTNHPLADCLIERSLRRALPPVELVLELSSHSGKVTTLQPHLGTGGWLKVVQLSVEALDQAEDQLLFAGITEEGALIEEDSLRRMLTIGGKVTGPVEVPPKVQAVLNGQVQRREERILRETSERNARFFEAETSRLDNWADDLKSGLEREIKEIDRQIKEARRAATVALTLEEKLDGQKRVRNLELLRNQKRRSLFDAQDDVDRQREELISQIERKLVQKSNQVELFVVRWRLV